MLDCSVKQKSVISFRGSIYPTNAAKVDVSLPSRISVYRRDTCILE